MSVVTGLEREGDENGKGGKESVKSGGRMSNEGGDKVHKI